MYRPSILIALALSVIGCAGNCHAKKNSNVTQSSVLSYFDRWLEGETVPYVSTIKYKKASEIEKARDMVWRAWCKADSSDMDEVLPRLAPLEGADPSSWTIPADLEPNAVMPFYWGYKSDSIPEGGRPLFIYLHGSGHKTQEWATGLELCKSFDDAPSIYFIPQIPNMGEYYRWWQRGKQWAWLRLLQHALASGEINPDRLYIFGISEGGYGSQRLASFYADYFAGAGPMAGGEPLKNAPVENIRNTAFSLRTGKNDRGFYRNILTGWTAEALDSVSRLSPGVYEYHVELIPDRQHFIDYKPTTPWLAGHVRNPYPKTVTWENFEMDGWYRNGFYNIAVDERSNVTDSTRTRYDMTIDGNDITMTVSEVAYTTVITDTQWGIPLKFTRSYTPAVRGRFTVYLNDRLIDPAKPVTLTVNGREVYSGKPEATLANMVNSCTRFFDPVRIYPYAIEVRL